MIKLWISNSPPVMRNKRKASSSRIYEEWYKRALIELRSHHYKPIEAPVEVTIIFYVNNKRSYNPLLKAEGVLSLLLKAHILKETTSTIVKVVTSSVEYCDDEHPEVGVQIYIERL